MMDQIHKPNGPDKHASAADTPKAFASRQPPLHRFAEPMYRKPLTIWITIGYLSFNSLRSRGGHAFPALIAARFTSRIAAICFACERVSSRRLVRPPRFPIAARYARTFFCASFISTPQIMHHKPLTIGPSTFKIFGMGAEVRGLHFRYICGNRCQKSAVSYARQPWQLRARCRQHAKLSFHRAVQPFA